MTNDQVPRAIRLIMETLRSDEADWLEVLTTADECKQQFADFLVDHRDVAPDLAVVVATQILGWTEAAAQVMRDMDAADQEDPR